MKQDRFKLVFGNSITTSRKETTSRMYNNPLIKLVRLLKGVFTFDEKYCYITIPFNQFYEYLKIWEATLCQTTEKRKR